MSSEAKANTPPPQSGGEFFAHTFDPGDAGGTFEVFSKKFLRIDLDGSVLIKRGTHLAHRGEISFRHQRVFKAGLKEAFGRELVPMAKAEGKGRLYCCDANKFTFVVRLTGGTAYVVADNVLAFEPSLEHDVSPIGAVGLAAGGILAMKLSGTGLVAISTAGNPMTLRATTDDPLYTNPNATVAWSGDLSPEMSTDIKLASIIGHGGGEEFQMKFANDGYVVVQTRKDVPQGVIKKAKSMVKKII